jgi:hypothetical protein
MATYGFDLADRQQSLTVQVGADPPQTVVSAAGYLPSGPLETLELGNGLTETRTYDGRYIPTGTEVTDATPTTLFDWACTTNGEGNITAVTDTLSPAGNRTYGYQDIHYFLTQGDGPWGALGWSYDKIGNRLTETRDASTDTYTYLPNPAAGHTALLDHITLAVGGTRDYTYGPAGHLEQVTAGANPVLFGSDDEGRLSVLSRPAAGASALFAYDGHSFLRRAAAPPAEIFADGVESGTTADLRHRATRSGLPGVHSRDHTHLSPPCAQGLCDARMDMLVEVVADSLTHGSERPTFAAAGKGCPGGRLRRKPDRPRSSGRFRRDGRSSTPWPHGPSPGADCRCRRSLPATGPGADTSEPRPRP